MKSVLDFDALPERPDLDSTTAFQRALDSRQAVSVPDSRFTIKRPLIFSHGSALVGEGLGPYDNVAFTPWEHRLGPTLLIRHNQGEAALVGAGVNGGIDGLTIAYPDQVRPNDPNVGNTGPRVYPPTILAKQPFRVTRCYLPNSYIGIVASCGRVYIQDCNIGAFYQDIVVDNAADVVRIDRTVISTFWDWDLKPLQPIDFWVLNHGVGITARKADGLQLSNVLVFGRNIGILFDESSIPDGAVSGQGTNVNLDTVRHGVVARATEERVGFTFTNLLLGPYWDKPGHAVWLQRRLTSATTPPRIAIVGGSIRHQWATKADGTDWAFRVDAGELHKGPLIGDGWGVRL